MAYQFTTTADIDSESPWDESPSDSKHNEDAQWTRLENEFTTAGYREGITAGKEAALQQGFDAGFAHIVPLGRSIGMLRGLSSALLAFLADQPELLDEAKAISTQLARIRFSDVNPRDEEAEQHALEHLADGEDGVETEMQGGEGGAERRGMEALEDMMAGMGGGGDSAGRPTVEDVARLRERLERLARGMGLDGAVDMS
ncbi:hypothetical protein OE88DRAFT_1663737 [Heliocybe sulcata]|uniref:Protein YAE1 n=1 Tax=Heliocybe sulcata TaxID=5364 RepID=A0A5C3MV24_9AGAM|nr:hypothetical protein OE88DRAFT_1663737 [Heliocybe sulcata]